MRSERPTEAYAWVWLPGAEDPVVAGRLEERGGETSFIYGQSFLDRENKISIYPPELPLRSGRIRPLEELDAPNCIRDAAPDAWGQRVIMYRLLGAAARDVDPDDIGLITFLLRSGSDRIGALDFQGSPDSYKAREYENATLDELASVAERIHAGLPLSPALDAALLRGSSVGGARPKALIDDGPRRMIAKFSTADDEIRFVEGEFIAMTLAARAGLTVPPVELTKALGKSVLLVERFDRVPGTRQRRAFISALTMFHLNELAARWASYADLAQLIRSQFTEPRKTLRELFARITFNILVGNNDDHARNHGAFWDGEMLTLTPAYDICPQLRSGNVTAQAMWIGEHGDPFKASQVAGVVERAHVYQLTEAEARETVDRQIEVIERDFMEVCDLAALPEADRQRFWKRQFLNPYSLEGYNGRAH